MQAVTGILWWIAVATIPVVRELTLGGMDPVALAWVDVPFFVGASALVACGVRWAVWIVWPWTLLITAFTAVFATVTTDAGWGALAMIAASGGTTVAALPVLLGRLPTEWIVSGPFRFRIAKPASPRGHLFVTAIEIVIFWTLFLGVIPTVILLIEQRWRLHVEIPIPLRIVAAVLFVLFASVGLWSAAIMSTIGRGTPLPAAMAEALVIVGPYRWVRNPMAVAGIGQGVLVGVMLSSWLVVLYALAGALLWNWAVRPLEEADLEARFGAPFARYRDAVRCWIPNLRPVPRQVAEPARS